MNHSFDAANIPLELRERRQWVLWSGEDGKKVPKQAANSHRNASTAKSATWCSFDEAVAGAIRHGLGIGFVFTATDPFVFVDLDWYERPTELQQRIIAKLATYTEVSPSGNGVHLFLRADKSRLGPGLRLDVLGVEVYLHGRYSTVTGRVAGYGNRAIVEGTDALIEVMSWLQVPEGIRANTMVRRAGQLRQLGAGAPEMAAILADENQRLYAPPLPEQEVAAIAKSVAGYHVSGYVAVPRRLLLGPEYGDLSFKARALLLDVAARFNGSNNGSITAPFIAMQERGWRSPHTHRKAMQELLASGLVEKTLQGRSHVCSRYCLPWLEWT
jgi:putative DNA primase/helicase